MNVEHARLCVRLQSALCMVERTANLQCAKRCAWRLVVAPIATHRVRLSRTAGIVRRLQGPREHGAVDTDEPGQSGNARGDARRVQRRELDRFGNVRATRLDPGVVDDPGDAVGLSDDVEHHSGDVAGLVDEALPSLLTIRPPSMSTPGGTEMACGSVSIP